MNISDDPDDLTRWLVELPSNVRCDDHAFMERISILPILPRHGPIDDHHARRAKLVAIGEHASANQGNFKNPKVSVRHVPPVTPGMNRGHFPQHAGSSAIADTAVPTGIRARPVQDYDGGTMGKFSDGQWRRTNGLGGGCGYARFLSVARSCLYQSARYIFADYAQPPGATAFS